MHKYNYEFKEALLPLSFCKDLQKETMELIDGGIPFTIVGMPAIGISFFMRFLATNPWQKTNYCFIHINIYLLPEITREEFFKLMVREFGLTPKKDEQENINIIKNELTKLSNEYKRVIILFNRFDQIKKLFDASFFNIIYTFRELDKEKICLIFSSSKPLIEIAPNAIGGANMFVYSKSVYFSPFTAADLLSSYCLNNPKPNILGSQLKKLLKLSGGHHQLFVLLINSERFDNPQLDKFIRLRLKELFEYLNFAQKNQLKKLASNKFVGQIDDYLLKVGMVKQSSKGYEVFTPLLSQFILSHEAMKLPIKESKLFKLLLRNIESVVPKEEIFKTIWGKDLTEASDWALNSLIYRLKKNSYFANSGYVIENQKKSGYIMYKF